MIDEEIGLYGSCKTVEPARELVLPGLMLLFHGFRCRFVAEQPSATKGGLGWIADRQSVPFDKHKSP